ncbi:MAG: Gfo/Idh/MocA family oxidoreductase, partial [Bacteroidales bacterium]|nr:Gfo/Idh/MocA family oxidoreductase [Bacteroidales bacterium]
MKVITYGTFDLLHEGHLNLLRRAKALGDYLVVGVTSENYDRSRGKLNVLRSLAQRIEDVKNTGFADEIIVEEYEGQKVNDIQKYKVNIFAIGSDWCGKFDYLADYCKVVYLERTKGISSTGLRNEQNPVIRLGIIGSGRIARRFVPEAKFVSGIDVQGVYNPHTESAKTFAHACELNFYTDNIDEFFAKTDAVYIASPHLTHADYIRLCLEHSKHVLCEKPMVLSVAQCLEMFDLAKQKKLVLMEAIKTAYCPAFLHLIGIIKSGVIGTIKDVDASFTKLMNGSIRELDASQAGGSMTELSSYVLLPIIKLLGTNWKDIRFYPQMANGIDYFTKAIIEYERATAGFKVGLGVKTEGELIVSGTKGYAYVPAPWWKTEYFELRYEDVNQTMKYFYKFNGDGLRYEIQEFVNQIHAPAMQSVKLCKEDSVVMAA